MERIKGRIKRVKRRLRDSGIARKLVAFAVIASTALSPLLARLRLRGAGCGDARDGDRHAHDDGAWHPLV